MTTYRIVKLSRLPAMRPYAGISCQQAGIVSGQTYATLDEAITDATKLNAVNPVGWQIVDVESGEVVRVVQGVTT